MNVLKYAFFLAADIVLIGCTVHYIFIYPTQCVKLEQLERPKTFKDSLDLAYVATAWLGVGISIYVAVSFLFSWMPSFWGSYFLAFLFAFVGSSALFIELGRMACRIHDLAENAIERFSGDHVDMQIEQFSAMDARRPLEFPEIL
jgi:hypothetical protein